MGNYADGTCIQLVFCDVFQCRLLSVFCAVLYHSLVSQVSVHKNNTKMSFLRVFNSNVDSNYARARAPNLVSNKPVICCSGEHLDYSVDEKLSSMIELYIGDHNLGEGADTAVE